MPLANPRRRRTFSLAAPVAVLLTAAAAALVGCDRGPAGNGSAADGSAVPAAAKARGNTFAYIDRGDIITLDLNQMSYMQDFRVTYAIREGLYGYDPRTAEPMPVLAKETKVSDDKLTWTFTLRDDAKWTNGDPVNAADFVFSWRLLLESPGQYTYLCHYIRNAAAYEKAYRDGGSMSFDEVGIQSPDPRTLIVTLQNPLPFFPDLLAFPPFYPRNERSMAAFKTTDDKGRVSYDAAYTRPANVVTNGPFKFTDWKPGQGLSFVKDPGYWDARNVSLDGIQSQINNDAPSAFVKYDQGEVDWLTDVSPDIARPLLDQKRADLRLSQDFGTAYLTINCAAKSPELGDTPNPLADVRVRRALAMTVDKQKIVDTITLLGERPADRYMPPGFFEGYASKPGPSRDVEAARKLLAEAGYPGGKGFPVVSICFNTDNPVRRDLAQFLSRGWEEALGVQVKVRPMELKGYQNYIRTSQYTMAIVAWYGDYMDPSTFMDKYRSTSLNNYTNWTPPEYDALLDRATAEPDAAKRFALIGEAESMLNEQVPILPVYYYINRQMYRDNVRGITPNRRNTISWKAVSVTR
jgi:oligopeptide transport system substrate-binding protein